MLRADQFNILDTQSVWLGTNNIAIGEFFSGSMTIGPPYQTKGSPKMSNESENKWRKE
jgi:hypothetical protein